MNKLEAILSFIDLFLRMKYLQIVWANNIDIESFVRIFSQRIICIIIDTVAHK
jgi:hypothetical protein